MVQTVCYNHNRDVSPQYAARMGDVRSGGSGPVTAART